jgi:hypothetical protein
MWGRSDSSHITKVISQIGLENVTRRALLEATDASVATLVEDYSKQLFTEQLSNVLKAAGAKAAGAIAASIGAGIIEAIWKQNDYLKSQINRLIRQPLISGSQMAYEAVNLPDETDIQRKFKEQRLNAAVDELFRAWGLLKDREADTFDRFVIAKLQGLCFHQMDGGREMAVKRLDEATGILERKNIKTIKTYYKNLKVAINPLNSHDAAERNLAKDCIHEISSDLTTTIDRITINKHINGWQNIVNRYDQDFFLRTAARMYGASAFGFMPYMGRALLVDYIDTLDMIHTLTAIKNHY